MIVYGLPVVLEELFLFFCWFRSYISFAQEVFFYMKISWLPVSSVSTDGELLQSLMEEISIKFCQLCFTIRLCISGSHVNLVELLFFCCLIFFKWLIKC